MKKLLLCLSVSFLWNCGSTTGPETVDISDTSSSSENQGSVSSTTQSSSDTGTSSTDPGTSSNTTMSSMDNQSSETQNSSQGISSSQDILSSSSDGDGPSEIITKGDTVQYTYKTGDNVDSIVTVNGTDDTRSVLIYFLNNGDSPKTKAMVFYNDIEGVLINQAQYYDEAGNRIYSLFYHGQDPNYLKSKYVYENNILHTDTSYYEDGSVKYFGFFDSNEVRTSYQSFSGDTTIILAFDQSQLTKREILVSNVIIQRSLYEVLNSTEARYTDIYTYSSGLLSQHYMINQPTDGKIQIQVYKSDGKTPDGGLHYFDCGEEKVKSINCDAHDTSL